VNAQVMSLAIADGRSNSLTNFGDGLGSRWHHKRCERDALCFCLPWQVHIPESLPPRYRFVVKFSVGQPFRPWDRRGIRGILVGILFF
jgi:hypothetical protein